MLPRMMPDQFEGETFVIDGREPFLQRIMLLAAGLFCIGISTWELRHAFTSFGWWTAFFGIILAGAWTVGLAFMVGAILGEGLHWTFHGRELTLRRRSMWRNRIDTIHGRDVARTAIRSVDWDSRADTFRVVVHLRSGEAVETPDYETAAYAGAVEAEIQRRLGLR